MSTTCHRTVDGEYCRVSERQNALYQGVNPDRRSAGELAGTVFFLFKAYSLVAHKLVPRSMPAAPTEI